MSMMSLVIPRGKNDVIKVLSPFLMDNKIGKENHCFLVLRQSRLFQLYLGC